MKMIFNLVSLVGILYLGMSQNTLATNAGEKVLYEQVLVSQAEALKDQIALHELLAAGKYEEARLLNEKIISSESCHLRRNLDFSNNIEGRKRILEILTLLKKSKKSYTFVDVAELAIINGALEELPTKEELGLDFTSRTKSSCQSLLVRE